jgi:hypothetical protein
MGRDPAVGGGCARAQGGPQYPQQLQQDPDELGYPEQDFDPLAGSASWSAAPPRAGAPIPQARPAQAQRPAVPAQPMPGPDPLPERGAARPGVHPGWRGGRGRSRRGGTCGGAPAVGRRADRDRSARLLRSAPGGRRAGRPSRRRPARAGPRSRGRRSSSPRPHGVRCIRTADSGAAQRFSRSSRPPRTIRSQSTQGRGSPSRRRIWAGAVSTRRFRSRVQRVAGAGAGWAAAVGSAGFRPAGLERSGQQPTLPPQGGGAPGFGQRSAAGAAGPGAAGLAAAGSSSTVQRASQQDLQPEPADRFAGSREPAAGDRSAAGSSVFRCSSRALVRRVSGSQQQSTASAAGSRRAGPRQSQQQPDAAGTGSAGVRAVAAYAASGAASPRRAACARRWRPRVDGSRLRSPRRSLPRPTT